MPEEISFKILVIGNSKVGKTKFIGRYIDNTFEESHLSTLGCERKDKLLRINNKVVNAQVWDTVGQERYQLITKNFLHNADGIILLYDITDSSSFTSVDNWAQQIKSILSNRVQVVLVGHKCDLDKERKVTRDEGKTKATELNMHFMEASAKDKINVNEVFDYILDNLMKNPLNLNKANSVMVQASKVNKKSKGCC